MGVREWRPHCSILLFNRRTIASSLTNRADRHYGFRFRPPVAGHWLPIFIPPSIPIARIPRSDMSVTLTPYFCPSVFIFNPSPHFFFPVFFGFFMRQSLLLVESATSFATIHWLVAKSFASFRTLTPCFRNDRIRSNSPELKCRSAGRPILFPARRACAIPAFTLSRRSSRSNSATAPRIENVSLPAGSVVSMFCRRETRSTPNDRHSSEMVSNCFSERASRSRLQTRMTSIFLF